MSGGVHRAVFAVALLVVTLLFIFTFFDKSETARLPSALPVPTLGAVSVAAVDGDALHSLHVTAKINGNQIDRDPAERYGQTLRTANNAPVQGWSKRVASLPGYGALKDAHYTGYLPVNDQFGSKLFFWFVESKHDPVSDPLILWLNGGTVCRCRMLGRCSPIDIFVNRSWLRIDHRLLPRIGTFPNCFLRTF
jgi:hypothetical protein